jgi:integrase
MNCANSHIKKFKMDNKLKSNKKTNKPRVDEVLSSTALTVTQCDTGIRSQALINPISDKLELMRKKNYTLYVFCSIQLNGGLRVSELLGVLASDVDSLGRLKVKGSKGSLDRVVDSGEHKEFVLTFARNGATFWATWSRWFIYREYKKYGIGLDIEGNERRAVTHALRHLSVKLLNEQKGVITHAKQLLGHKSENSTKHYVESERATLANSKGGSSKGKSAKGDNSDKKKRSNSNKATK